MSQMPFPVSVSSHFDQVDQLSVTLKAKPRAYAVEYWNHESVLFLFCVLAAHDYRYLPGAGHAALQLDIKAGL